MIRRNFLKGFSAFGIGTFLPYNLAKGSRSANNGMTDREYWVTTVTRVVQPVLQALSENKLKVKMPVEAVAGAVEGRKRVTYLEALGRSLAGIAPWLELGPDTTAEGRVREKFINLAKHSISNAVNPASPDYMNFTEGGQPLVDAAFLAHALLRAPSQLWGNLDKDTRQNLVTALKSTKSIKPHYSNWLLFTAMVEAALLKFTNDYDAVRIDYAIKQHEAWYKGDGVYGDGPELHVDYYNSYVIHPMLLDIVTTVNEKTGAMKGTFELAMKRAMRYAEIQERMISPEGTFPLIGRSLAYRCGAFQLLAQMALQKKLSNALPAPQVRSALTAVIKRSMNAPNTFDKEGWLQIGFCGHQPQVGESYISTGSLYLCTTAFLPLGLPATDKFWTEPDADWTSKRAYAGKDFLIDHAI